MILHKGLGGNQPRVASALTALVTRNKHVNTTSIDTLVYIVDSNERLNLNSGRPPSTHFTSDDTDCIWYNSTKTGIQLQQLQTVQGLLSLTAQRTAYPSYCVSVPLGPNFTGMGSSLPKC